MVEQYVEQRGTVYYLRMRVPERFREVEVRPEINTSLKTRCPVEAHERATLTRASLHRDWEARLAGREAPGSRAAYEASIALLKDMALPYRRMEDLVTGPLEEILQRIEALADRPIESAAVPAALGTIDLPGTLVSELPAIHERVRQDRTTAKNARQLREWRNKYLRAVDAFVTSVSDKPVAGITAQDARRVKRHWDATVRRQVI